MVHQHTNTAILYRRRLAGKSQRSNWDGCGTFKLNYTGWNSAGNNGMPFLYAPHMGIPASETLTYCRKVTYPRTNGKVQS